MSSGNRIRRHVPDPLVTVVTLVYAVIALAVDRNLTYLAAAIAFYAFISIIPLILLTVAIASFIGGETLTVSVVDTLSRQLSSAGQESLSEVLTDTSARGVASVIGFFALAWSALKLFRGLDLAFDELYLDDVQTSLPAQLRNGSVVVLGIALAIGLVVATGVVLSFLSPDLPFVTLLGSLLLSAVLGLTFLPIYYVLPPVEVSILKVLPGAAVAASGWVVLQFGFQLYATHAADYAAYGMIGAVLLFVTWLYFASVVVLLGGAVNATLHERTLQGA